MAVRGFMHLSDLLNERAISLSMAARDKESAIKELVQLLEAAHGVNTKGEILSKVLQRESMMSTGIGNGVAIPHGKARAVSRMVAAAAVSPEGVDFQSVDGEPAMLFVLLAAPETVGSLQVKVLANISRVLKEEGVRQSLRDAASSEEFLSALIAAEAVHIPQ